jgi:hypothetical protein
MRLITYDLEALPRFDSSYRGIQDNGGKESLKVSQLL